MSFFPKIHFVDEMPEFKGHEDREKENIKVAGHYEGYIGFWGSSDIWVLKRRKWKSTLFHELCHWFFYKFSSSKKPHQWLDRNNRQYKAKE